MKVEEILLFVVVLAATAFDAEAGDFAATNVIPGNFDQSSGTRTVFFTGLEPGYESGIIKDVNISINFAKADGENPFPPYPGGTPFHNEIHFRLTSPGATPVTLIAPNDFNAGNATFDGTITFDQAAAQIVNINANTPQAGTFRPSAGSLDDFNGEMAAGLWELFIQDTVGADSLRFRNFTLNITTVPEPSSLMGLGVVLGGLLAFGRRSAARVKWISQ